MHNQKVQNFEIMVQGIPKRLLGYKNQLLKSRVLEDVYCRNGEYWGNGTRDL